MDNPLSRRRHGERATPRKLTVGEKLAVFLIQHMEYPGGVSFDERGDFFGFPCTYLMYLRNVAQTLK